MTSKMALDCIIESANQFVRDNYVGTELHNQSDDIKTKFCLEKILKYIDKIDSGSGLKTKQRVNWSKI